MQSLKLRSVSIELGLRGNWPQGGREMFCQKYWSVFDWLWCPCHLGSGFYRCFFLDIDDTINGSMNVEDFLYPVIAVLGLTYCQHRRVSWALGMFVRLTFANLCTSLSRTFSLQRDPVVRLLQRLSTLRHLMALTSDEVWVISVIKSRFCQWSTIYFHTTPCSLHVVIVRYV